MASFLCLITLWVLWYEILGSCWLRSNYQLSCQHCHSCLKVLGWVRDQRCPKNSAPFPVQNAEEYKQRGSRSFKLVSSSCPGDTETFVSGYTKPACNWPRVLIENTKLPRWQFWLLASLQILPGKCPNLQSRAGSRFNLCCGQAVKQSLLCLCG